MVSVCGPSERACFHPGLLAHHGGEQEGRMERTVNVSQTDLQSTSLEGEADWKAG